jgi:hypothetical protein
MSSPLKPVSSSDPSTFEKDSLRARLWEASPMANCMPDESSEPAKPEANQSVFACLRDMATMALGWEIVINNNKAAYLICEVETYFVAPGKKKSSRREIEFSVLHFHFFSLFPFFSFEPLAASQVIRISSHIARQTRSNLGNGTSIDPLTRLTLPSVAARTRAWTSPLAVSNTGSSVACSFAASNTSAQRTCPTNPCEGS